MSSSRMTRNSSMPQRLVPLLRLQLLLACLLVGCGATTSVVPSSQSKSFWDQINANNEQRRSSGSVDGGGSSRRDDSASGSADGSHSGSPESSSGGSSSSASLREVLESRKARRNLECRPDFCYQMQVASGGASSGAPATRVCGTDGKTYDSRCMLQFLRRCHSQKVRVRHLGACGSPLPGEEYDASGGRGGKRGPSSGRGKCQDMRLAALDQSSNGRQVIYVPQCANNGRFRRVQCNYQLRYCFCVRRRSGKPLPGTGVQLPRRPSCRGGRRRRKQKQKQRQRQGQALEQQQQQQQPQNKQDRTDRMGPNDRQKNGRKGRRKKGGGSGSGSGRKNRCSSRQRAQFNRNILKQFEVEFNASLAYRVGAVLKPRRDSNAGLPIHGTVIQDRPLQQPERRSAEWKFTELDANSDGYLSYRETKALRKVTRANIKPKSCARGFFSTCDLNANKQLERAEWILCFGLENSSPVASIPALSTGSVLDSISRPASGGGVAAPLIAAPTLPPASLSVSESAPVAADRGFAEAGGGAVAGGSGGSKGSLMELVSRRKKRKRARKARPFARKSCPLAREEALEKNGQLQLVRASLSGVGGSRVFVPECSADGKYAKRQCHTSGATEEGGSAAPAASSSLCFCMDPDSGRVLKSRGSAGAVLDCESALMRAQAAASAGFRGCPAALLRQFASQLTALMVHETRDAWRPQDGHLSVEARSLKLRFQRADVNRDGRLDRQEQRWWRREIKAQWKAETGASAAAIGTLPERRRTRKCAANFLRFCNANDDSFATLAELQACLSVPDTS